MRDFLQGVLLLVILMIAGAIGLIIALVFLFRRRGRPATEVYEERRYTEPPA